MDLCIVGADWLPHGCRGNVTLQEEICDVPKRTDVLMDAECWMLGKARPSRVRIPDMIPDILPQIPTGASANDSAHGHHVSWYLSRVGKLRCDGVTFRPGRGSCRASAGSFRCIVAVRLLQVNGSELAV